MLEIFLFKLLMITRVQLMFQIPLSVGWLFLMGKDLLISKVKSSIRPAEQTLFLFYSWILDLMSRELGSVGRKKREKKSPRRPQDMVWASALLCSVLAVWTFTNTWPLWASVFGTWNGYDNACLTVSLWDLNETVYVKGLTWCQSRIRWMIHLHFFPLFPSSFLAGLEGSQQNLKKMLKFLLSTHFSQHHTSSRLVFFSYPAILGTKFPPPVILISADVGSRVMKFNSWNWIQGDHPDLYFYLEYMY